MARAARAQTESRAPDRQPTESELPAPAMSTLDIDESTTSGKLWMGLLAAFLVALAIVAYLAMQAE